MKEVDEAVRFASPQGIRLTLLPSGIMSFAVGSSRKIFSPLLFQSCLTILWGHVKSIVLHILFYYEFSKRI
jgi:hypothetical protein